MKINKVVSSVVVALGIGFVGFKWFNNQKNIEGSEIWYRYASLDSLKKYREKVGEAFMNSGINNLSENEYVKLEREKIFLDNSIGKLENMFSQKKYTHVSNEHGWYLSSD